MEHIVPEEIYSSDDVRASGVSAIKALSVASKSGQKIYTLNEGNIDVALSNITLQATIENEIYASVTAGKLVVVHEKEISYKGWVGAGYLIIDKETGGGAYKISGGYNGGDTSTNIDDLLGWISSVSEEFIDKFGGVFSKAFVSLKGTIEKLFSYVDFINNCDPIQSRLAIASLILVGTGLGSFVTIATAINPLLGLAIAVFFVIPAMAALSAGWRRSCEE